MKGILNLPIPKTVRNIGIAEVIIEGVDLVNKVWKYEVRDNKVVKAVEKMKWVGVKMLRDK